MVVRKFIEIDEEKCDGCGACVVSCAEGALQVIDGKARVVKEQFCDGLGACIGHCPQDALEIVEKDVEEFDEEAAIEHVRKLRGETPAPQAHNHHHHHGGGCPGAAMRDMRKDVKEQTSSNESTDNATVPSQLQQWPVQLHLVNPAAPYFNKANLLVAATCSAFSYGNFHHEFIKDHTVVVACPKLDRTEGYIEKLASIIAQNELSSITVVMMEVPCCHGLSYMVNEAINAAGKKVPYMERIISINGNVID